jgi:threonine dehydrogenase-like Zn-dependent dehydrogenase
MHAWTLTAPFQSELIDIPEPTLGSEDVLVEVHYIGLCGSDLNTYRGLNPMVTYPRIPGHEVSGTVLSKGEGMPERIAIGARVTVSPYSHCGLCPACRQGRFNCCEFNETLGVQRDGALTRRFAIPYTKLYTSAILTPEELALVEPLSVGYHSSNRARITEMDTVLVIGAGTVGIGAIAAAERKGATVIVSDVDERKLASARAFGATHVINSARVDALEEIRQLTDGEGVSVAIEAVGLPATYRLSVEAVCFAGRVTYIGYSKKEVSYDTKDFVRKELDIMGSRNALRELPAVIRMLEQRQRPFTDLISRVYPFAEAAQAFHDWDANPAAFAKILIDVSR